MERDQTWMCKCSRIRPRCADPAESVPGVQTQKKLNQLCKMGQNQIQKCRCSGVTSTSRYVQQHKTQLCRHSKTRNSTNKRYGNQTTAAPTRLTAQDTQHTHPPIQGSISHKSTASYPEIHHPRIYSRVIHHPCIDSRPYREIHHLHIQTRVIQITIVHASTARFSRHLSAMHLQQGQPTNPKFRCIQPYKHTFAGMTKATRTKA
jgi:hypothetical protein